MTLVSYVPKKLKCACFFSTMHWDGAFDENDDTKMPKI